MHNALLILPDFALILLGFALRRALQLGDHFWSDLERLIYMVLFPALLFNALARSHFDFRAAAPLVACGLTALATGIGLGLLARPLFKQKPMVFASQFQGAFRYNSYIGLAVAGKLYGAAGIAAMGILVGTMVPFANLAAVWMLARHGNAHLLRELAKNPLILATLAGLAFNAAGLELSAPAAQFLGRLAEASIALGLLAVGAALRLRGNSGDHLPGIYFLSVKHLAVPTATWLAAVSFGLPSLYFHVAVMFAALPTASSAYILAVRMGGDGPGTAWLISASTLAGMLTLPMWLMFIGP
ncbi:MAG: AEC family transporter [Rhodocyclaceae bacterium]|nr:AEC family transporter [Rhodocyclaceae bacterium]